MGIVIKICTLLQIFLPILENRELLTHVIATKSMTQMRDMSVTIYRPDKIGQTKSARQIAVCKYIYLKANLNLVDYYDIYHDILC